MSDDNRDEDDERNGEGVCRLDGDKNGFYFQL